MFFPATLTRRPKVQLLLQSNMRMAEEQQEWLLNDGIINNPSNPSNPNI